MGIFDNIKNVFTNPKIETKQSPMVMMQNVGYGYTRKDKYEKKQQNKKNVYSVRVVVYKRLKEL